MNPAEEKTCWLSPFLSFFNVCSGRGRTLLASPDFAKCTGTKCVRAPSSDLQLSPDIHYCAVRTARARTTAMPTGNFPVCEVWNNCEVQLTTDNFVFPAQNGCIDFFGNMTKKKSTNMVCIILVMVDFYLFPRHHHPPGGPGGRQTQSRKISEQANPTVAGTFTNIINVMGGVR